MVPPGSYTVRLVMGDKSITQDFIVATDPRVEAEGMTPALFEKQYGLQQKITQLLTDARLLQDSLEKESEKLEGKKEDANAQDRLKKIKEALQQLKNDEGAYPQEMLVSQISYLYNMVTSADQVMGKDVYERYQEVLIQFNTVKGQVYD